MIVDTLDRLDRYTGLNPRFKIVVDFLRKNDLSQLQQGIHNIDGTIIFIYLWRILPPEDKDNYNKYIPFDVAIENAIELITSDMKLTEIEKPKVKVKE